MKGFVERIVVIIQLSMVGNNLTLCEGGFGTD